MAEVMFNRVALIGIGLIGSSLARRMKRDGLAGHIAVNARSQASLDTSMKLGFADSVSLDPCEVVKDADLVVVCSPVGTYAAIGETIKGALKKGAILSDVG